MKLRSLVFCLLIGIAFQISCYAEVTKLSLDCRKALQVVSSFRQVYKMADLPAPVKEFCTDHIGRFADPGQNWQVTDVIYDDTLPGRRLIWAAVNGEICVLHYESGGRGTSGHVLIISYKEGVKFEVLWHGGVWLNNSVELKDFSAFIVVLNANTLYDALYDRDDRY